MPYFGDPQTPDALQPLTHSHQVDTSGTGGWSSIEMLTRPDGSAAESVVILADGTQVRSTFRRTLIARRVTLASGDEVRIETDSGVQTVTLGDDKVPLFQSAWTPKGPVVVRARQRVAFMLERGPFWPDQQLYADPGPANGPSSGSPATGIAAISAAAQALLSVYAAQQTAPASQGLGDGEKPSVALKAWTVDGENGITAILVDALTEEQLSQDCKYLLEVQMWTDEAAVALAAQRSILPARTWGSLVHGLIKRTVDAFKKASPLAYSDLEAKFSLSDDPHEDVSYGKKHSTRLDVIEVRYADGVVCDYDIKTGLRGFDAKTLLDHARRLALKYPGMTIFIIEVRPRP